MKIKTIFAASLLATGVAFADTAAVDAECVVGVLPVSISGNEVILSIPWIEAGRSSGGVAVANLVKTAGLAVNDSLLWYDTSTSKYEGWHIESINGTNQWVASASVLPTGISTVVVGATALNRGQAILLSRASAASTTIYIVGQPSDGNGSSTIAAGTVDAPVFSLLASPAVSGDYYNLSTKLVAGDDDDNYDPALGDQVVFENTDGKVVTYTWGTITETSTPGWGYSTFKNDNITFVAAPTMTISAGKGFWYKRCGAAATINW